MRHIPPLCIILCLPLLMISCGGTNPQKAPTKVTPTGAKVDLTGVSLSVDKASIVKINDHKHELRFEYTLENKSGSNIQFPSIHPSMDRLVEVSLTDKDQQAIHLVKNSLAGLTLPQPTPRKILAGKTTRSYSVPIIPNTLKPNDPVNVRIRLHVPSRFDELRSSLEAPTLTLAWPEESKKKKR